MYHIVQVAVEGAAPAWDKEYSYLVPDGFVVRPGTRVRIPFGQANRRHVALVLSGGQVPEREKLKPLLEVLDPQPILDREGLALLRYLKEHTFCTWFEALRLLVPAGLSLRHRRFYAAGNLPASRLLSNEEQQMVEWLRTRKKPSEDVALQKRFGVDCAALQDLAEQGVLRCTQETAQAVRDERMVMVRPAEDWNPEPLRGKQKAVMDFLAESEAASLKEVCYFAACTRAVPDALQRKGAVEYYEQPVLRSPFSDTEAEETAPEVLSPQQQAAFEGLARMLEEYRPAPALLYGVTGSGKTQVYLRLIQQVLESGRTALVLVPEIALTAQAVERFLRRFGSRVAVLHSALSLGERMDQWKRIRSGEADIVVGTRSAVFAPLQNLGLIVMDEEQEHTYKSEKSPRFHAREVARWRAVYNGALLVLASATPSVESYHAATSGRYRLVELEERFGEATLPDVFVVDMKESENLSGTPWLSNLLECELRRNLELGQQSILLLNRRGYATVVKCSSCATVADCPHCSVALTWHRANESLICHYCGYMQGAISVCGHCGSGLVRYAGAGTQKLEEELTLLLPNARVLRVDMDTTMARFSHQKLFGAFSAGEYDIMIGTQMVAKGLDFPNVTLVGVLSADQTLYSGDFRSFERAFSLLTQVVGRGGRGEVRGRAVVQTYSPESPVIRLAASQDYRAFFADEIYSRKIHLYPPFCSLAGIGFVGESLEEVRAASERFLQRFQQIAAAEYADLPIRLLGPVPSDILRAAGKYRYKLVLKCRDDARTRALLREVLAWFRRECRTVHAFIDMYYDKL